MIRCDLLNFQRVRRPALKDKVGFDQISKKGVMMERALGFRTLELRSPVKDQFKITKKSP